VSGNGHANGHGIMRLTLDVWRQKGPKDAGRFERYEVEANEHMSFLEMLDVLNNRLVAQGKEPVAFDSDCREGICGMCGFLINGEPHGPLRNATVCQTHMRHFKDGDTLRLEPWRAAAFPVLRDLVVDRSALDRIVSAGGFISTRTGSAVDANAILVPKQNADRAMEAAACIGCGACVASCPNASAALFTSAKVAHMGLLPQGQPERLSRSLAMAAQARHEGFGHCTTIGECEAVCPAGIKLEVISFMNKDFVKASLGRPIELQPLATLPKSAAMRLYESEPKKAEV
jgi:succinate dehydrogenase / fumarate reductase iron-sulfur subunit